MLKFKLESHNKNDVICRFGDKGTKFYIILKGKCQAWLPMTYSQEIEMLSDLIDRIQNVVT